MASITKRLEIDAGHRLLGHESKCANLHGHRYAFEIRCEAATLDKVGRVIDFGVIKERVGGWLDVALDHAFIVNSADAELLAFLDAQRSKCYVVPFNPTAENLADFVLRKARVLLEDTGIWVSTVTCWETPTSRAEAP